jgi:tRNA (Thr-GGU) A37 N-methylase
VFASRAPVRPNPIGLSLVELVAVEGTTLRIRGVDLLDGTPVLDLKPWFADCDQPIR